MLTDNRLTTGLLPDHSAIIKHCRGDGFMIPYSMGNQKEDIFNSMDFFSYLFRWSLWRGSTVAVIISTGVVAANAAYLGQYSKENLSF